MPHVVVKCYRGRSEEQLQEIAKKIAASTAEAFGLQTSSVSVAVEQVEKEAWKDIYQNEIYGNQDTLYIEPGYEME